MAWSWSGATKGAGTGAAAGGMAAGPKGAIAGGGLGFLYGGLSGGEQEKADKQRQEAMVLAQQQQAIDSLQSKEQRQIDLDRTMALYGPALQALERLYGIPMSAWGQALPQNRPPTVRAVDGPKSIGPVGHVTDSLKKMGLWDQLTGAAPIPPGSPVRPNMQQMGTLKPGMSLTPLKPATPPPPIPWGSSFSAPPPNPFAQFRPGARR